ncbi:hypothetical protein ACWC9T_18845 [Kitasatospora sp. NPDC001159]
MPDPATTMPTDAEIAGRIRGGPRQGGPAAQEIAGRYRAAVLAYAALCCRDGRAAEELADEALTRTLDAVRAGAGPTGAWHPYLLAAVRRTAASWADTGRQASLSPDFASWLESLPRTDPAQPSAQAAAVAAEEASLLLRAFRSLPQSSQADLWQYLGAPAGTQAPATPASTPHPRPDLTARHGLYEAYLQVYVSQTPNRSCRHLVAGLGDIVRSTASGRTDDLDLHLSGCDSCERARTELIAIHTWQRATLAPALLLWPVHPSAHPSADAPTALVRSPTATAASASARRPDGTRRHPASPRGRVKVVLATGAASVVLAIVAVAGTQQSPSDATAALSAPPSTATPTTPDPPTVPIQSPTPSATPTTPSTPTPTATPTPVTTPTAPPVPPASTIASPTSATPTTSPASVTPAPATRSASPLPGAAPAAIVGDGRYHSISAVGTGGQVLEVNGTCSSPLTSVADINTWWTDHTSEQWTFTTNPDGTVRISDNCDTPTHVHTVLSAGNSAGNSAYLLNYSPGNPWQEWRVMQNTTTGALTITNVATGLALDTTATNAGSTAVTNTANGATPGQSWTLLS